MIRWSIRGCREESNTIFLGRNCSVECITSARRFWRIDGGFQPFVREGGGLQVSVRVVGIFFVSAAAKSWLEACVDGKQEVAVVEPVDVSVWVLKRSRGQEHPALVKPPSPWWNGCLQPT